MSDNPHTGSSFDDWLREEGLLEECTTNALARIKDRLRARQRPCVLPDGGTLSAAEALRQLEAFLQPRIEEVERGEVSDKSVEQIFEEARHEFRP